MSASVLRWLFSAEGACNPKTANPRCPTRGYRKTNNISAETVLSSIRDRPFRTEVPPCPTLRANPFPEVTDLFCRLPLSTLFYRPEAANLGDLMRLWVRPGVRIIFPSAFHGRSRAHRTPRMTRCFTRRLTLSPDNLIPG